MKKAGKEAPLISVIVPVYNVEKYVGKCLDSIIHQTYTNLEIIVVDDGSTDASGKICEDYAKKDSRIKVIHQKNGGLANARNTGIEYTKGKYVTFIDSDDWVEQQYVTTLYNDLSNNQADISVVRYFVDYEKVTIDESTGENSVLSSKECISRMLYDNGINVMAWGKLYRKELFNIVRYPDGKDFEDVATTYKLVLKSRKVYLNSIPLYHYQKIDQTSITNASFSNKKIDLIWATEHFTNNILKKYPDLRAPCNARMIDAYIRTLTETLKGGADQQTINNLLLYIKQNRKTVLKDPHLTKRCRSMIMSTILGYRPFKAFRHVFELITGRRNVYAIKANNNINQFSKILTRLNIKQTTLPWIVTICACNIAQDMLYTVPFLGKLLPVVNIVGLLAALIYVIYNLHEKANRKNTILFLTLLFIALITYITSRETTTTKICLLTFAFYYMGFHRGIKIDFCIRLFYMATVVILSLFNLTTEYNFIRLDGTMRSSFGFFHPNMFGMFSAILVMEAMYLTYTTKKHQKIVLSAGICVFLINFFLTQSRTSSFIIVVALLCYIIPNRQLAKLYQSKSFTFIVKYSFVIFTIISITLALSFSINTPVMRNLNMLLSQRPHYANTYLKYFSLSLFGANIPDRYWNMPLDNMYLYTILHFGIIQFSIYCVLSTQSMQHLIRKKYYFLTSIVFITMSYGIMENIALRPGTNVFILALLYGIPNETRLEKAYAK